MLARAHGVGRISRGFASVLVIGTLTLSGLTVAVPPALAGTTSATWDTANDFLLNASTTGETTSLEQLTVAPGGTVSLKKGRGIAAGRQRTLGIKGGGTIVWAGYDYASAASGTSGWTDIIDLASGDDHTVGLRSDGTVVATGTNDYGQCNVSSWTDIVDIACGQHATYGVTAGGTVVVTGASDYGEVAAAQTWTNITQISASWGDVVGLTGTGTVVAAGWNGYGQCDVGGWTNVKQVEAGGFHTVGLKNDGTVIAQGLGSVVAAAATWTTITQIAASNGHAMALKSDGTVVAAGYNTDGQCDLGTWSSIVEIAASGQSDHSVGLRADGTVMTAGYDGMYECSTPRTWTSIGRLEKLGLIGSPSGVGLRFTRTSPSAVHGWSTLSSVTSALRSGEAVKFAVRLSLDGVTWSAPLGYDGQPISWTDGTGNYFGAAASDTSARCDMSALPAAPYVEVIVHLEANGDTAPTLDSVTLGVTTNELPVAVGESFDAYGGVGLGVSATAGVLTNDTDPDDTDTLIAVLQSAPTHGSLTLNGDGSFLYLASPGYVGADSFTYVANDGYNDSNLVTVSITVKPVPVIPVYRFYNTFTGAHFYTSSIDEKADVEARYAGIFRYEGIGFSASSELDKEPLYRFYNKAARSHFYTASPEEKSYIESTWPAAFVYEGTSFCVSVTPTQLTVPVYRFYNTRTGAHFYTSSEDERARVAATWPHYRFEGIAFYVSGGNFQTQ